MEELCVFINQQNKFLKQEFERRITKKIFSIYEDQMIERKKRLQDLMMELQKNSVIDVNFV